MISEKVYRPDPPLCQFVDTIWVGQAPSLEITSSHHAALFTELIFNYGDTFQVKGQHVENFGNEFVHHILSGLKTEPFQTKVSGAYVCVGLILKPFCHGILLEKFGTRTLEQVSTRVYESIFDSQTPDFKKLERYVLDLFNDHQIDSDLIKFEHYISENKIQNGSMRNFNLLVPISQKSFIQKFKRYYLLTPNEYLKLKRVDRSIQLIKNNKSLKLTEIGLESGFYDQSHFIRTFKKFCGYTPKNHLEYAPRVNSVQFY